MYDGHTKYLERRCYDSAKMRIRDVLWMNNRQLKTDYNIYVNVDK